MKAATRKLIEADAAQAAAQQPLELTFDEWMQLVNAKISECMELGLYSHAAKLAMEASKAQAKAKAAELAAKHELVAEAKAAIELAVHDQITVMLEADNLLELVDGYWISYDRVSGLRSFSLFKPTKQRVSSNGGGASKRYSTTQTLLTAYGDQQAQHLLDKYGISVSWQQAFDERVELAKVHRHGDTKNFLHTDIHKAMLKVAGEIS